MSGGPAVRVQTYAEQVVLDDGAASWRAHMVITVLGGGAKQEDDYTSEQTFATEAAALADARARADQIMDSARRMGGRVLCARCNHPAHLDACSCGCAARRAL